MKTILGYLRPHAPRVAVGVTVKFTAAVLELLLPLLLAHIIDDCVPARDLPAVWRAGGLMLIMAFGAALCNITANRMAAWVSMDMTRQLRRDLYQRTLFLSQAQLERFTVSSIVSRLTNDTYNVHQMFDKIQRGGIRAPMLVLGGLVLTFFQAPSLAFVQLAVCSATFFAIWLVTRQGIPRYTRAQEAVDTVVRVLRENASGVRVVKALACQGRERERFTAASRASMEAEQTAGRIMAAANPLADFLLNLGLVLVVLAGALLVDRGRMASGQIVAFLSYFTLIQTATLGLAKLFVKFSKGVASARRIEEVLLAPEDQRVRVSESAGLQGPELGMENVSFSYLGVEKDLDGASFTLNKGETLGILGPTGSGKTTLVSLLLRLYDADGGVVWLGGRDVSTLSREELRGRFGVVFQNEALLNDSVYENISFLRGLSREDVTAAAKTAQAWEFIEQLPEGLDAKLDIRGANLSGGQRQRLLAARALAARPNILILDSADSALDYRTAAALHAAIRRDFPGVTQVIISERVASLRDADRILVLEDGVIAAQGTHQELLETCGRYRRMAELQMGGSV
ncbi:MAG: ABC transporter ATP-binding protein [Oscillibacter sp.]|nr:ABC transporter ATP-binding protein [uncultured Oscillibacter sp.]MCI9299431.1 ABC transporter ATP-binding protein [Oscillibacter sp.]MCI9460895.1 ABC transporter ATP-binding protein [Oscillibacter sp.]